MMRKYILGVILFLTLTLSSEVLGQADTTFLLKKIRLDTNDRFYNYVIFDSVAEPKLNFIAIKKLWLEKTDTLALQLLSQEKEFWVQAQIAGPRPFIEQDDGSRNEIRSCRVNTQRMYIDTQNIRKIKKKDFDPKTAGKLILFYKLTNIQ